MASVDGAARSRPSVFLSYASEDRVAARALRDALSGCGLDAWYDESDLGGGEAWDQSIRRQIRDCDYFMPVISARTNARAEGYFRREWRLAVERTLDMADDHPFLLPVVIDETDQATARVPEKFLAVQWLRVPGGLQTAALEALCRRIGAGEFEAPLVSQKPAPRAATPPAARDYPPFPAAEAGPGAPHWMRVIGWAARSAWVAFGRWPRWVRIIAYSWLAMVLLSKGCASHSARAAPEMRTENINIIN